MLNRISAALVRYGSQTVETVLTSLLSSQTRTFEKVSDVAATAPAFEGEIVIARYAAKSDVAGVEGSPVGGGMFIAFNDRFNKVVDGGVFLGSPHPTLKWKRHGFTEYHASFWGVIPDYVTDNADAIDRAHNFAAREKIIIQYPAGFISTSKPFPIYTHMGARGYGRGDQTIIHKTTNAGYDFKNASGVTVESHDALMVAVPANFDRASPYMDSFCTNWTLEGFIFRRAGLTLQNYPTKRPSVGAMLAKSASFKMYRVNFEGGYIGVKAYVNFSCIFHQVGVSNWKGMGYTGYELQDYRAGGFMSSGTSIVADLMQFSGFQYAMFLAGLQYSSFRCCTFENLGPTSGETYSYAVKLINPYSLAFTSCATEFAEGQIQISMAANPSFRGSCTFDEWFLVDAQNPKAATPIIDVDNVAVARCTVKIRGGDFTRVVAKTPNLAAPKAAGNNDSVVFTEGTTGARKADWTITGGAKVYDLEP